MESGRITQPDPGAPLADPARISQLYGIDVCTAQVDGVTVVLPRPAWKRQEAQKVSS